MNQMMNLVHLLHLPGKRVTRHHEGVKRCYSNRIPPLSIPDLPIPTRTFESSVRPESGITIIVIQAIKGPYDCLINLIKPYKILFKSYIIPLYCLITPLKGPYCLPIVSPGIGFPKARVPG